MDSEVCECYEDTKSIPSSITPAEETKICKKVVNFGYVEAGSKKYLKVHVENMYKHDNVFTIKRDPSTNPLYQVFGFNTYKISIPSQTSCTLKAFYKPLFRDSSDTDYFELIDSHNNTTRICMWGMGSGPNIQASTNFVRFHLWDGKSTCRRVIEFQNESVLPAKFYFDVNEDDPLFKLDKVSGVIEGKKNFHLNITFTPTNHGSYCRQLECLFLNHEPIFIKLFGVYSRTNTFVNLPLHHATEVISDSYMRYMRDVQLKVQDYPLYSLSETYFDFGGIPVTDQENRTSRTLVTSITNHTARCITVSWENNKDLFTISPKTVDVPSNESVLFECVFEPLKPDCMYGANHYGSINFGENEDNINVPTVISVRYLANTFSENQFWLPQLEILPEVIVLPPTIPSRSTFVTFQLKAKGHLPVSFAFLHPKKTNFIIKPMIGIVKDYKIIVAQLYTEPNPSAKVYVEQWNIMLNGQKDHVLHFYIKGYSQNPDVVIGDKNRTKFTGVQTGCTQGISVPIRNACVHHIRYEFLEISEPLEIDLPCGELDPNENKMLHWKYKANSSGSFKFTVTCQLHIIEKIKAIVGKPFEVKTDVYIDSHFSELCSFPKSIDLKVVTVLKAYRFSFRLSNYGSTVIYYLLKHRNQGEESTMIIHSAIGSLQPAGKKDIFLNYTAKKPGQYVEDIVYLIRKGEDSHDTIENYEQLVFQLRCTCIYPYVQIIDIAYHNFGPLFTKNNLWDIINIDKINLALRTIRFNEKKIVDLNFPDNELSYQNYYVILILKNLTEFQVDIDLKRRKLCDCEQIEICKALSLRKKQYFCPHRQMLKVDINNTNISPKSISPMHINLRYGIEGLTTMSYNMLFSKDRNITLDFHFRALKVNDNIISVYQPTLQLQLEPVCLVEQSPSLQAFWLYNNSKNRIDYQINIEQLYEMNSLYNYEVIWCINPLGTIERYSCCPLLFRFVPIEEGTLELDLELTLGTIQTDLYIKGKGTKHFKSPSNSHIPIVPFRHLDVPIALSEDTLILNPFPTWSMQTRMIFMKNMSSDFIGYSWKTCTIPEIIEIKVAYPKGILRPKESHPIVISIYSFDETCKLQVELICKLLDHTKYYLHKQSVAQYNMREEQIKDQFTITEDGTSFPENDVVIQPFPDVFYTAVTLHVKVTGIANIDLYHTVEEQFKFQPQYSIRFDNVDYGLKALPPILDPLDKPVQVRGSLPYMEKRGRQKKISNQTENVELEDESIKESNVEINHTVDSELYKTVFQCLIADVVFSNQFREILAKHEKTPPLYYSQIRRDSDAKHRILIDNLYKDAQAPLVSEVIRETITDSVHNMFNLGPQIKKRPHADYLDELRATKRKPLHTTKSNTNPRLTDVSFEYLVSDQY